MIAQANSLRIPLKDHSVHMICTSPPYWQLRTYGTTPQTWGGDPACEHAFHETPIGRGNGDGASYRRDRKAWRKRRQTQPGTCSKCGAWRGEYGLEPAVDCLAWTKLVEPCGQCYICHTVQIFREIWRVLRPDGTLWVNIGDSYSSSGSGPGLNTCTLNGGPPRSKLVPGVEWTNRSQAAVPGLRRKDLIGVPQRLRFALQYDGWCCRSEIIWHKTNVMPESPKDRPCRDHEYVFLFSKRRHYYYDNEAIKERASPDTHARYARSKNPNLKKTPGVNPKAEDGAQGSRQNASFSAAVKDVVYWRNKRTVWPIAALSYTGAHFATFPEDLVEPMILAGTSEKGCCPNCGTPWKRILVPSKDYAEKLGKGYFTHDLETIAFQGMSQKKHVFMAHGVAEYETRGWKPGCNCPGARDLAPVPCIVFDPFCGSGTAGRVALKHRRRFVGLDLQKAYLTDQAAGRLKNLQVVLI